MRRLLEKAVGRLAREIEVVLRDGLNALWLKATGPAPYDRAATQWQLEDVQKKSDEILQRHAPRATR